MGKFRVEPAAAVLAALAFVALCAAFVLPLAKALSPAFGPNPAGDDAPPAYGRLWRTVGFTLGQALASTLLALCLGVAAAFLTARRKLPGSRLLLAMSAVPMCVPPLLVALGFVMFFGMRGAANRLLMALLNLDEPPLKFLYSFRGIVIAHGFYNFPLVMRTCHDAWKSLPAAEHDAAVLLGAGRFRVFRTITVFQLLPAVASSAMVVFLYCFFGFVIVLLFGGVGTTVLEVEIYQAARSTLDFVWAARLALAETAIAAAIISAYGILESRGRESKGLAFDGGRLEPKELAGAEKCAAAVFWAAVALFFAGPLLSIALSALTPGGTGYLSTEGGPSFGFDNFARLFSRPAFWKALANSVITGASASVLAVLAATFLACCARSVRSGPAGTALRTIPLLPMAVSSVVLGLGITRIFPRGSPALLVVSQAATCWPLAFKQISAAADRIPGAVLDAASCLSRHRLDGVFRVMVPMCNGNIAAALGFCFAASCGDTTLPLMLAIPGFDTLALHTYKLAGAYRFNEACASGVVLALLTVPAFLSVGASAGKKRKRK